MRILLLIFLTAAWLLPDAGPLRAQATADQLNKLSLEALTTPAPGGNPGPHYGASRTYRTSRTSGASRRYARSGRHYAGASRRYRGSSRRYAGASRRYSGASRSYASASRSYAYVNRGGTYRTRANSYRHVSTGYARPYARSYARSYVRRGGSRYYGSRHHARRTHYVAHRSTYYPRQY